MTGLHTAEYWYRLHIGDASYYWLHEVLQIRQGELIETYVIECNNDFDTFYDKYRPIIDKLDVENMEIVAFQVTTCNDECAEIKKNGLRNLQWVLSNDTALCKFLKKYNISFDIESKLMYVEGTAYDVDYDKYMDLDVILRRKEQLHKIGHNIIILFVKNLSIYGCNYRL